LNSVSISRLRLFHSFNRVVALLKFLIKAEKEYCKIQKRDVAIYGADSIPYFSHLFSDYGVVYLRGERINLRSLLRAALSREFLKDPLFSYSIQILKSMNPRVILTAIDNDVRFFSVSNIFPNAITIMVQNGVRDDIFDVWSRKDNLPSNSSVNYMFVFGNVYRDYIKKYIKGTVIVGGSHQSNRVPISKTSKTRTLLVISQILRKPDASIFGRLLDGTVVTHFEHSNAESALIPIIGRWCALNNYQLKILARTDCIEEQNFFSELLSGINWDYCVPGERTSPYQMVDEAEIVVGINSTLVLESLARGNRTAVFSIRGSYIENFPTIFWPDVPKDVGPFWTNSISESEVNRVLSFLVETDLATWENCLTKYVSNHIIFDSGNLKIGSLIASMTE
jgi:surface carbohydrate biosynthesis protein